MTITPIHQALIEAGFIPVPKKKVCTPEEVKAAFINKGLSISEWARANSFTETAVYRVLNGFSKAQRGTGHKIAVALGLKENPETFKETE